jgi:hypothetical protein
MTNVSPVIFTTLQSLASKADRIVKFLFQESLRRQLGQVLGDSDAAVVQP